MHTALPFVLFHLAIDLLTYLNVLEDVRLPLHWVYTRLVEAAAAER